MNPTKDQLKQAFNGVVAMAEAIRTAKEIPSGHLYAIVMCKMDLAAYGRIISILKNAGLVAERNDLLTWVGPEVAQ